MRGGVTRSSRCLLAFLGFLIQLPGVAAQGTSTPSGTSEPAPAYVDRVIENLPPQAAIDGEAYVIEDNPNLLI